MGADVEAEGSGEMTLAEIAVRALLCAAAGIVIAALCYRLYHGEDDE